MKMHILQQTINQLRHNISRLVNLWGTRNWVGSLSLNLIITQISKLTATGHIFHSIFNYEQMRPVKILGLLEVWKKQEKKINKTANSIKIFSEKCVEDINKKNFSANLSLLTKNLLTARRFFWTKWLQKIYKYVQIQ